MTYFGSSTRRRRRWLAGLAIGLAIVAGMVSWRPGGGPLPVHPQTSTRAFAATGARGDLRVVEQGYTLLVNPTTAVASILSPDGRPYTSFPLTMLAGLQQLPAGARRQVVKAGDTLVAEVLAANGSTLSTAVLEPSPLDLTVHFTARPGPDQTLEPRFFYDGGRGLDLSAVSGGFTPDTTQPPGSSHPSLDAAVRTPLAPPPLDVELQTHAGWLGFGLVQVPDATTLRVDASGALTVDYPLGVLASIPDAGGGGMAGDSLQFPDFVITFASDPLAGLRVYDQALVALGTASPGPAARPDWWQQPLVDTWGEQAAAAAVRGSPLYTATWVERFVQQWRQRFGVSHFTVVIDSEWQAQIGEAEPDPVRFGGWTGMRRLIDDLHSQGLDVVLWWPMWEVGIANVPPTPLELQQQGAEHVVDPTVPGFAHDMAATVRELLGSAPGELNADGLKLDWGYDVPASFADPAKGWGDAALYRYLQVIHDAAHALKSGALVESSAAAPQFAAVTDSVRLYDAWSEAQWETRAAIVSEADPGVLIDGDGWDAGPWDAIAHAVASTVWGVPASYFATHWTGGAPLPPSTARTLGTILSLSTLKGWGQPTPVTGGEWIYTAGGAVRAQTFGHETGLVVWQPTSCRAETVGKAVSATGGSVVVIPIPRPGAVGATDGAGHRLKVRRVTGGIAVAARAGTVYTLTLAPPAC